jgi:ADP-heptose:LPS heptosyltransferase
VRKFLIIQTAFIGDVVLATPVIKELKRIYPDSEIDFLLRKGNEPILANNPHLKTVYTFDKKKGKLSSLFGLVKQFRKRKYDEIINLHRFASSGLIAILSDGKKTIGFTKNPLSVFYSMKVVHEIGNGLHEVERNLMTIQHHGAQKFVRPEVFPSKSDYEMISSYVERTYFCLAPASVWFTKQLPEEKWVELAKKLLEKGKVYLIGGASDFDLCERIRLKINDVNSLNFAGKFSFLESAALFQTATMNYVNDSGPMHFCSAVNASVTAFFCSTTPEFGFGPLTGNSKIIETNEELNCKPCGLHGFKSCPKGHFKCGLRIDLPNEIT